MTLDNIQSYLLPGRHAHLVGIGGVSMCPLAEVLHGMGLKITGSDLRDGNAVEHLRSLGIAVEIGHKAENIAGADLLIRTAAAHDDNPEIEAARKAEIPVFERAQAWGFLMRAYPNAVCISGTHGKTTTTSMVTHITMAAGRDPTVMIGGTLPLLGSGHRVGGGDTIILEACEYCDSFLSFRPTVAVILNIDADHLDYFHDLARVERSFRDFAALVPPEGSVIANGDDENTMRALRSLGRRLLTFGFGEGSDVRAVNVRLERGGSSFDVIAYGKPYASIKLPVPGRHNVKNALAAAAVAVVLGIPGETAAKALSAFLGAGRRFEKKGTFRGADVYDDYAHHPGELRELLTMAGSLGYRRVICAFQPHTYTRTKTLFSDFVTELSRPDLALLADIYAAREPNEVGVSSRDLAEQIPGALYFPELEKLTEHLKAIARPGDLILTVGAGDIYTVGEALVKAEENEDA